MNQKQRDFLINTIEAQFRTEKENLNKQRPTEPSLNNYLTAAILDGSFKMHPPEVVRESIRTRVRDMGKDEALLSSQDSGFGRRSRRDEDEGQSVILPALLLFEMPPAYAESKAEYDAKLAKWREDMKALESAFQAMKIKVQLGSDKALEALIGQADALCSMSLTATSRTLLAAPAAP